MINIPYLIEPYNAYQKPPKKKHWMEQAEEEALYYRLMMEVEKQKTAQQIQITNAIIDSGAGGVPPYSYFNNSPSGDPYFNVVTFIGSNKTYTANEIIALGGSINESNHNLEGGINYWHMADYQAYCVHPTDPQN